MHPMHRTRAWRPAPRLTATTTPAAAARCRRRASRPRRRGGRGRAPRGDVRTAVLLLLAEEPMHGYQLMQAIAERSGGRWTPSPGAIYPTINQLEDEGLVTVTAESGRKLVTLTDAGREHVDERRETSADPFAGFDEATARHRPARTARAAARRHPPGRPHRHRGPARGRRRRSSPTPARALPAARRRPGDAGGLRGSGPGGGTVPACARRCTSSPVATTRSSRWPRPTTPGAWPTRS